MPNLKASSAPIRRPRIKTSRVIGHRGAHGHAPENTLAGFKKAANLDVKWVEFDCMLTGDKVVVLNHDDMLERTTGTKNIVGETDYDIIKTLDVGRWYSEDFAGETIPTLSQALKVLGKLGLRANIEIKPCKGYEAETGRLVAREIADHWPANMGPPLISSFSIEGLTEAQKILPNHAFALMWWKEVPQNWLEQASAIPVGAIHLKESLITKDLAKDIKANNFDLRCFTVNDHKTAQRLFDWGLDAMITDHPENLEAFSN